jgi:hypothetical protein
VALHNVIHVTFDFIQTLVSHPLFDEPAHETLARPQPNGEALAYDDLHNHAMQGDYQEESDPDIDLDDFFGGDV